MGSKVQGVYNLLIELSGVPKEEAEKEFFPYFQSLNMNPESITLDDMRKVLQLYLLDCQKGLQGLEKAFMIHASTTE